MNASPKVGKTEKSERKTHNKGASFGLSDFRTFGLFNRTFRFSDLIIFIMANNRLVIRSTNLDRKM